VKIIQHINEKIAGSGSTRDFMAAGHLKIADARAHDCLFPIHDTLGNVVELSANGGRGERGGNDDQIGRFRELSEAGVAEVMISLPDLDTLDTVGDVISAFRV
jgi:hypothetical protein